MPLCLLLDDETTRDDIDDAMERIHFALTNLVAETRTDPRLIIFRAIDGTTLTFVEDGRLGARCAVVEGYEAEGAAALSAELRLIDPERLQKSFASKDVDTRVWALKHAALLRAADLTVPMVLAGLLDRDPDVRSAAALAALYVPHPDVARLVEERLNVEKNAAVVARLAMTKEEWATP